MTPQPVGGQGWEAVLARRPSNPFTDESPYEIIFKHATR